MISVGVANTKGGSGKTTIATHVAAHLALRGWSVVLADLDRQRSATGWVSRRPSSLAAIRSLDLSRGLEEVGGVQAVVYDAPAAAKRKDLERLLDRLDLLILPVAPSAFDEDGTRRFLKLIADVKVVRKHRLPVLAVGVRVRPRSSAAHRLGAFLRDLGHPAVASLRDSASYAPLAAAGRTVFDEHDRRSRELAADWAPLVAELDRCTP